MNIPHSDEQNAQILYDFATATILPLMKPDGVWIGPDRWPLPTAIIEREFRRIAEHESYKPGQTIICESADRQYVTLTNGEVKIDDPPDNLPWAPRTEGH